MPGERHPTDALTDDLVRVYENAHRQLENTVRAGLQRGLDPARVGTPGQQAGDATLRYRERARAQSKAILEDLRRTSPRRAAGTVETAYGATVRVVDRMVLGDGPLGAGDGPQLTAGFGNVHVGAVEAMASNMAGALAAACQRVGENIDLVFDRAAAIEGALVHGRSPGPIPFLGRRVNDPYRRIALETVASGTVSLDTRKQISAALVRNLLAEGVTDALTGYVDSQGRRWPLHVYAETAVRTLTREASSRATVNRMTEGGLDLVKVSTHPHKADVCSPYDGETFSLSGEDSRYHRLTLMPPFHPRCRHVLGPASVNLDDFEEELRREVAAATGARPAPGPVADPAPPPAAAPPQKTARQIYEEAQKAREAAQAANLARQAEQAARAASETVSALETLKPPSKGALAALARKVCAAIDRVHRTPAMPQIPLKRSSGTSTVGAYRHKITGDPVSISISSKGGTEALTLAHEFGHFLDHKGLPGDTFATRSKDDPAVIELLDALNGSEAAAQLRAWTKATGNRKYGNYLTSDIELFARAYAQYIAVRSGDEDLLEELDRKRRREPTAPTQWDDEDFTPIAAAFDRLFTKLGLR